MSPRDAFYHLVHDYPGGAPALAVRLGMNKFTLEKKADPNCMTHRPTFDEVLKAETLTGDLRPLHAHAEALGCRVVRVDAPENVSDEQLLANVSAFMKETGEALVSLQDALADGRITETEIRRFEKQVADIAPTALALAARMRSLAEEQARKRAIPIRRTAA